MAKIAVLLWMLSCGTLAAQGEPNDLRDDAYDAWITMSNSERMAYVSGILVGSAYWANSYYTEHWLMRGEPVYDPFENLPLGIANGTLVKLVDLVYERKENRDIPLVVIIMNPTSWNRKMGR